MPLLEIAAVAAVMVGGGAASAQSLDNLTTRLHQTEAWCHDWVGGATMETVSTAALTQGFADEGFESFMWRDPDSGVDVLRFELWDVPGGRSCHAEVYPGPWEGAALARDIAALIEARDGYVAVPDQHTGRDGTLHHYRLDDRDAVIISYPDRGSLTLHVLLFSLWTGMGPQ